MKALRRAQFGNPILRQTARPLMAAENKAPETPQLITAKHAMLTTKKHGVALAAPQVGHSLALFVVNVQPTKHRPDVTPLAMSVCNPVITKTYGRRWPAWEGCLSFGASGDAIFAQALRYPKIRVSYLDEQAKRHEKDIDGLLAQIFQHETDHLNGILFVERVKDPKTYTNRSEYIKCYRPKLKPKPAAK